MRWWVGKSGWGELDVEYAVWGAKCESCELEATSYVLWQHVKPIYFDMKHINLYLIHVVLFLCTAHKVEAEEKGVKSFSSAKSNPNHCALLNSDNMYSSIISRECTA